MPTADDSTQKADARAAELRHEEYRAREHAGLTDEQRSAIKSEADSLIAERDSAMKRGLVAEVEAIDERLRALGYREEQSTNAHVQREFARRLPDADKRDAVAAGRAPADLLGETATAEGGSTKGKTK